jgi:hypothetical protein
MSQILIELSLEEVTIKAFLSERAKPKSGFSCANLISH